MIKSFHPGDLWQDKKVLKIIQSHRNIKTFQRESFSILVYMFGPVALKAKVYLSRDFAEKDALSLQKILRDLKALQIELQCTNRDLFGNCFQNFVANRQATYLIDLSLPESILFKNISGKRRSQIRNGIRKGVTVTRVSNLKIFDKWWEIYKVTSARGGFPQQKKKFIWEVLQLPECLLFTAWQRETLLAGNIIFNNHFPFYWLGASRKEFSKLNAPSILQWNIIKSYRQDGHQIYDLNGAELDPFHGPTRFKKSLGAELIEYEQLRITPSQGLSALANLGAKFYYKYLKRTTW